MDYTTRLSRIEKQFLGLYSVYSSGDRRADERIGANHGKKGIPSRDETGHPFRDELVTKGRRDLTAFQNAVEDFKAELQSEEERLTRERDEFYIKRRDEARDQFDSEIASVERTIGDKSAKHSDARTAYNENKTKLTRLEMELGRPLRIRLRWTFAPIMAGVALLEVPVNRFAFEYFFGESAGLSLALAVGFGCVLTFVAHLIGMWLKHSTAYKRVRDRIGYYVFIGFSVLILGPLFYFLALIREKYVQFIERTSVSFGEMLRREGVLEAASTIWNTQLTEAGWTLLFLNLALFGIGILASFIRHDAHPDYESLTRRTEKGKKRYDKIRAAYEKKVDQLAKARDELLAQLERQHERIANELSDIDKARELLAEYNERASKTVALHAKQRLQVYELANRQARAESSLPKVFGLLDEAKLRHEIEQVVVDFPSVSTRRDAVS